MSDYSNILRDVKPEECFWMYNGKVLRNIYELRDAIISLNDFGFKYHVNSVKDDFSIWIKDVLNDTILIGLLKSVKKKDEYVKIVCERILDLERISEVNFNKTQEKIVF